MKTISLAAILLATLTLVMVNATGAQSEKEVMMTGTVVRADGDKWIINTAQGEQTFKFKSGVMPPAGLAPGAQVTMWVDEDDADDNPPGEEVEKETYTVFRMSITPAATPPPATTPEPAAPATPPPSTSAPTTPPPTTPDPAPVSEELPATASPLALIGILGLVALASGIGLRARRRHTM
jgi:cell division septation protein DedD